MEKILNHVVRNSDFHKMYLQIYFNITELYHEQKKYSLYMHSFRWEGNPNENFSYLFTKTYAVSTHQKCLIEYPQHIFVANKKKQ